MRCPTCGATVTVAHGDDERERTRHYIPLAEAVAVAVERWKRAWDAIESYQRKEEAPSVEYFEMLQQENDAQLAIFDALAAWEAARGDS